MSRRRARVTQAEMARALRAAERAGGKMTVVVDPDGTIRFVPAKDLPGDGAARNASGYVEARLADAPWAQSK